MCGKHSFKRLQFRSMTNHVRTTRFASHEEGLVNQFQSEWCTMFETSSGALLWPTSPLQGSQCGLGRQSPRQADPDLAPFGCGNRWDT